MKVKRARVKALMRVVCLCMLRVWWGWCSVLDVRARDPGQLRHPDLQGLNPRRSTEAMTSSAHGPCILGQGREGGAGVRESRSSPHYDIHTQSTQSWNDSHTNTASTHHCAAQEEMGVSRNGLEQHSKVHTQMLIRGGEATAAGRRRGGGRLACQRAPPLIAQINVRARGRENGASTKEGWWA